MRFHLTLNSRAAAPLHVAVAIASEAHHVHALHSPDFFLRIDPYAPDVDETFQHLKYYYEIAKLIVYLTVFLWQCSDTRFS